MAEAKDYVEEFSVSCEGVAELIENSASKMVVATPRTK
jgi:hypothetical protein